MKRILGLAGVAFIFVGVVALIGSTPARAGAFASTACELCECAEYREWFAGEAGFCESYFAVEEERVAKILDINGSNTECEFGTAMTSWTPINSDNGSTDCSGLVREAIGVGTGTTVTWTQDCAN